MMELSLKFSPCMVHAPTHPLQDYKVNPGGAQPYATVSMYSDLVESKDLGLIRADITPNLSKKVRKWSSLEHEQRSSCMVVPFSSCLKWTRWGACAKSSRPISFRIRDRC